MSIIKGNRWFSKLAIAGVAAVGLAALTVPLHPAKAQLYFGFGPGGFGVGVAPPYYAPYYAPPYYAPYYGPSYYYGW
ncbi:MAG TPA: hypothetical protein VME41_02365 [Stellaceae bacterium]|nr:hypothetical protein [Stellaceae bacterium]